MTLKCFADIYFLIVHSKIRHYYHCAYMYYCRITELLVISKYNK